MDPATVAEIVPSRWALFTDTLAAAAPDAWDRPTRLTGWTVEELARHVHWGVTLEADGLALVASGGAGPAEGTAFGGPRAAVVPALRTAVAALGRRLAEVREPLAGAVPMPYGPLPLPLALHVFVMEAALHTSDLVDAVGEPGAGSGGLPPETWESCATAFQAFWPVLGAGAPASPPAGTSIRLAGRTVRMEAMFDGTAWGPVEGEPSAVVEGDDDAVLLYAYGRLPLDRSPLSVHGDRGLALRFKEFVPGP